MITIILFLIILGLLVFVHELGHFVMAKRAGMRVDEFGFGFPPRIFGIRRGETLYSVNWIPLGGFVKILGEDGSETSDAESFGQKTAWQRFAVLIAGVTMNALFAWLLVSIGLGIGLPAPISDEIPLPSSARVRDVSVTITEIAKESPAEAAGLKPFDVIQKINNEPIESREETQSVTLARAGHPTEYEIRRGNDVMTKTITPRANPPEGQGALGVGLESVGMVSFPWHEAIYRGFTSTVNLFWATLSAFGQLIGDMFEGKPVGEALSGPVGIAVLTSDVAKLGFIYLLQFTAVLSVNLAILNALPFPALDGGRILFLAIEKIRRKKLPVKAEQMANTIGFLLLITLMVFVTIKDVGRFEIIDKVRNLF